MTVAPGLLGQLAGGDQRGQHARADQLAALVDEEAAVGVAVEGQADVGAGLAHLAPAGRPGWPARSGWPRGWGRCRRARSTARTTSTSSRPSTAGAVRPAMPLPASTTTVRRRPVTGASVEQVRGVVGQHVLLGDRARRVRRSPSRRPRPGRGSRRARSPCRSGAASGAAHLDAVVLRRVVAGGEHRAGPLEAARGEVELVGRGEPDQRRRRRPPPRRPRRTPATCPARTAACRARRRRRRAPVTDDERVADPAGEVLVDLVGDGPAHVVGLEDGGEVASAGSAGRRIGPTLACVDRRHRYRRRRASVLGCAARAGARGGRVPRRARCAALGAAATATGRGWAASRTASARASRSSEVGPGAVVGGEPQHLPAAGRGQALAVGVAQVVGVRLGVGRERADDRGLVGVDVGERGRGGTPARGARTATEETHERDATTRAEPTPP